MRKKSYSKLDVKIRYEKQHRAYRIIIDGDVFWADTYEHAIVRLFYVLSRDEFKVCDCKCTDKLLDSMDLKPMPEGGELLPVLCDSVNVSDDDVDELPY